MNDNDNKFISRNMYTGSRSRKPILGAIATAVFGVLVIAFGAWRYFSMTAAFDAGETVRIHRYESLIYDIAGFIGIGIVYLILGLLIIYYAYSEYKDKTKVEDKKPEQ